MVNAEKSQAGLTTEPVDSDYCTADGLHVHKCKKCGTTWSHPKNGGLNVDHIDAHTCPKPGCYAVQFWKHPLALCEKIDYPWEGRTQYVKDGGR
jgi:hypothetical protein